MMFEKTRGDAKEIILYRHRSDFPTVPNSDIVIVYEDAGAEEWKHHGRSRLGV